MVTDGLCTKAKEEGLRYYNNKMALVKKKMPLSPKEFNEDHIEHLSNAQAKFFQVLLAVAHSPKGKACDGEFQVLFAFLNLMIFRTSSKNDLPYLRGIIMIRAKTFAKES
jgi:hypothetical protein